MIHQFIRKRLRLVANLWMTTALLLPTATPLTGARRTLGGPTQPEVQSFQALGAGGMVDPFTGDFSYSLPLLELPGPNGGYPFNLAYQAAPGIDQDASWVGLGWNLNPGAITRQVRGVPDEFNGEDQVTKTNDARETWNIGGSVAGDVEIFGLMRSLGRSVPDDLSLPIGSSLTFYTNSERGNGIRFSTSVGFHADNISYNTAGAVNGFDLGAEGGAGGSTGLTLDSQGGADLHTSFNMNFNFKLKKNNKEMNLGSFGLNQTISSRDGRFQSSFGYSPAALLKQAASAVKLPGLNLDLGLKGGIAMKYEGNSARKTGANISNQLLDLLRISSPVSYARFEPLHPVRQEMTGRNLTWAIGIGAGTPVYVKGSFTGFESSQRLKHAGTPLKYSSYGYLHMDKYEDNRTGSRLLKDGTHEAEMIFSEKSKNLAIPYYTQDLYTLQGHGVSGIYRPYHRRVGYFGDSRVSSIVRTRNDGGEVGIPPPGTPPHIGIEVGGSNSTSTSEAWPSADNGPKGLRYSAEEGEPSLAYFKAYGETSIDPPFELDHIGGMEAVRLQLHSTGLKAKDRHAVSSGGNSQWEYNKDTPVPATGVTHHSKKRAEAGDLLPPQYQDVHENRNQLITPVTNDQLALSTASANLVMAPSEYNVVIETAEGAPEPLDRTQAKQQHPHHYAGYTATNPAGTRYVYGLPVYNLKQVEHSFARYREISNDGMDNRLGASDLDTRMGESNRELAFIEDEGSISDGATSAYRDGVNPTFWEGDDPKRHKRFNSRTELPAYAHAHMLTSILGADYVDDDGIPGPSEGDKGYWVKFTYKKVTSDAPYRWRTPHQHHQYNYSAGDYSDPDDDMASYLYGEKELYYLSRAETRSHVAIFETSPREDGMEAIGPYPIDSEVAPSNHLYRLDAIKLYTRSQYAEATDGDDNTGVPIQTVAFSYDYELCQGVPHNPDGSGKLTLNKVTFTYGQHTQPTVYQFGYGSNPDYNQYAYDRWGNYAPKRDDQLYFPYTGRPVDWTGYPGGRFSKAELDRWAGAWSLSEITLPSGAVINVTYEADDYAYVQNLPAMRMVPVAAMIDPDNPQLAPHLPNPDFSSNATGELIAETRRLYFWLDRPVTVHEDPNANELGKSIAQRYLDVDTRQLYFKSLIHLTDQPCSETWVSGSIEFDPEQCGLFLPDGYNFNDGPYLCEYGYVDVPRTKHGHPFRDAAMRYLRTDRQQLLAFNGKCVQFIESKDFLDQLKELMNTLGRITELFTGSNFPSDWCREYRKGHTYIRLKAADGFKPGGGHRIRKVVLTVPPEEGEDATPSVYGQLYEYTTVDENGATISSGVATNEPSIGHDENALHYFKNHTPQDETHDDGTPVYDLYVRTSRNQDLEYPINYGQFSGPQVGYSQVRTMILVSAAVEVIDVEENGFNNQHPHEKPEQVTIGGYRNDTEGDGDDDKKLFYPTGTGATVQQFYTAKDFPVITGETELEQSEVLQEKGGNPIFGEKVKSQLSGTQGYVVRLNNMHGQPKAVYQYPQESRNSGSEDRPIYAIATTPINSTEYFYRDQERVINGQPARELTSQVPVHDGDGNIYPDWTIGQEQELVVEARRHLDKSSSISANFNIDWIQTVIPIPIPINIPHRASNSTTVRTAVANKIIHQTGVLDAIRVFDGTATLTTRNELWDYTTGEVVMTSVENDFGDRIYSYQHLAHHEYAGMGHADRNMTRDFTIDNATTQQAWLQKDYGPPYLQIASEALLDPSLAPDSTRLFPGDQFLLQMIPEGQEELTATGLVTYIGTYRQDKGVLSTPDGPEYLRGRHDGLAVTADMDDDMNIVPREKPAFFMFQVDETITVPDTWAESDPELSADNPEDLMLPLKTSKLTLTPYRSGHRNLLAAKAGSVSLLSKKSVPEKTRSTKLQEVMQAIFAQDPSRQDDALVPVDDDCNCAKPEIRATYEITFDPRSANTSSTTYAVRSFIRIRLTAPVPEGEQLHFRVETQAAVSYCAATQQEINDRGLYRALQQGTADCGGSPCYVGTDCENSFSGQEQYDVGYITMNAGETVSPWIRVNRYTRLDFQGHYIAEPYFYRFHQTTKLRTLQPEFVEVYEAEKEHNFPDDDPEFRDLPDKPSVVVNRNSANEYYLPHPSDYYVGGDVWTSGTLSFYPGLYNSLLGEIPNDFFSLRGLAHPFYSTSFPIVSTACPAGYEHVCAALDDPTATSDDE